MQRRSKILLAAVAALAVALTVVLIARDGDGTEPSNATDVAFVTDMVPHHQGAVEMAEVARRRAEHAEIRSMADDVIRTQNAEISVMRRIADDFHAMNMNGSGHMGMSQDEMGMDLDMPMLESAKRFDRAFIDMMVPHHQGAIRMARIELAKGKQPALRRMARDIIDAQTREIAQMRQWRKRWYGSSTGSMHGSAGGSMMEG